jgi:hypothetical protein
MDWAPDKVSELIKWASYYIYLSWRIEDKESNTWTKENETELELRTIRKRDLTLESGFIKSWCWHEQIKRLVFKQ